MIKLTKTVLKRTLWMARGTATMMGLAVMLALVAGVASTAVAGTGVGATFNLGQTNTVNAISKLVGSVTGSSLQIDNNSSAATATALDLQVEPGKDPMKVNSQAKVDNLNADKVDGKNASSFVEADTKTYTLTNGAATGPGPTFEPLASSGRNCDDGDLVLTGGVTSVSDNGQIVGSFGFTDELGSGWRASVKRIGNENATIDFRVTCLDFPPLRQ